MRDSTPERTQVGASRADVATLSAHPPAPTLARARLSARANLLGQVMTWIDPAAQKSHALNDDDAGTLVAIRANLRYFLPLAPAQDRVLGRYIAAHDSTKPSIWADRESVHHT